MAREAWRPPHHAPGSLPSCRSTGQSALAISRCPSGFGWARSKKGGRSARAWNQSTMSTTGIPSSVAIRHTATWYWRKTLQARRSARSSRRRPDTTGHHVHRGTETKNDYRMIPLCGPILLGEGCHTDFEENGHEAAALEERAIIDTLKVIYKSKWREFYRKASR